MLISDASVDIVLVHGHEMHFNIWSTCLTKMDKIFSKRFKYFTIGNIYYITNYYCGGVLK
jgi:hypothetical protein